jgi:hypothetical protein
MNSNELADKLENAPSISEVARLVKEHVIPLLRYQQASIDRLLSTKPRPLTDEEINTEMLAYLNSKTMGLEDFAKSILKKESQLRIDLADLEGRN